MATALYGFAGLCISFSIARRFVDERWAFWATVGVWLGTSLPVYMYLHTSWPHALSAFATSLFLWYWLRTRQERTGRQWLILGLLAGLMIEVYYLSIPFLLAPSWEAACAYLALWRDRAYGLNRIGKILQLHLLGVLGALVALLPRSSPSKSCLEVLCRWTIFSASMELACAGIWKVLFSASHGLLVFTPIVLLAFWVSSTYIA